MYCLGDFDDQSTTLMEISLCLNEKALLENLMKQINESTKRVIESNRYLLQNPQPTIAENTEFRSNGDHLEAAQALSEISVSPILQNGKKKITPDMIQKRNVKRVRIDSVDLNPPSAQVRRRSRMSSLDVVTEALRLAEGGRIRTFSDINNIDRDSRFHQPNFGDSSDRDPTMGAFRRGSESLRQLACNSTPMFGRNSASYSMAAAAEAVRLAEAENNLNSLTNLYQIDGSSYNGNVNGLGFQSSPTAMGRRPSYRNEVKYQGTQNNMEEAAINNLFVQGESFSRPPGYFGLSRIDAQMMSQFSGVNGQINAFQSNLGMGNWCGDSSTINAETVQPSGTDNEARRRSSLTDAIRLVEMDALRRNSSGISMAAAAEAMMLSELNSYNNQRMQNALASESYLNHSSSFDNLAALMRRSNGPNASIVSDAKSVSLAELESWSRRSFSGSHR